MVLVGLLFAARIYPVVTALWHWDHESMGDAMIERMS